MELLITKSDLPVFNCLKTLTVTRALPHRSGRVDIVSRMRQTGYPTSDQLLSRQ